MKIEALDSLVQKSDQPEKMAKIVQQLKDVNFSDSYMTGREILKLPELIQQDETIKYATSGFYDTNTSSVLIVVTNKRILLENKKLLFGSQNTEIPLGMVNDISYNSGMLMAKVSITSGTKDHKISQVSKKTVTQLVDTIRHETELAKHPNEQQSSQSPSDIEQLKGLKDLLDSGILTQEEFEAKKKQILGI
ncbi:PH domain-containing protein [Apilactobacillus kunkeei]|uniref:PH domain-containing protein n=1 Tax=Apilactobacillus kunkeei TaxID=148814 RepID=UPI00200A45BD|nr:PH domain-containing protein [Apilactobacillus kunkeei]MCK8626584.1 PH domain-containing protein [Apilactobacillus kunkeei]